MTETKAPYAGPYVWCFDCRRMRASTVTERVWPSFTTWGWAVKVKFKTWRCDAGHIVKSEEA